MLKYMLASLALGVFSGCSSSDSPGSGGRTGYGGFGEGGGETASVGGLGENSGGKHEGGAFQGGAGSFGGANLGGSGGEGGQGGSTIGTADVQGFWSGDWGDMVLREINGELWGAYSHDEGTLRGTVVDSKFTGWWCEVPTRLPPTDAGDVQFDFVWNDDGTLSFDGRWRYASEVESDGAFHEDWDLSQVNEAEPAELVARFDDSSAFCSSPTDP